MNKVSTSGEEANILTVMTFKLFVYAHRINWTSRLVLVEAKELDMRRMGCDFRASRSNLYKRTNLDASLEALVSF